MTDAPLRKFAPGKPAELEIGRLLRESASMDFATSFKHIPCPRQPGPNEYPELDAGRKTNGCDFKRYAKGEKAQGTDLDIPALFKLAKEEHVHIRTRSGELQGRPGAGFGSGVIVGRKGDQILVMTDNHVVIAHHGASVSGIDGRFCDGKIKEGKVVVRDERNDIALVAYQTGKDTDKEYRPARIAENWGALKRGRFYLTTGFPEGSQNLHESPGKYLGMDRSSKVGHIVRLPGEDRNRPWGLLKAQTRHGNSGGATYDKEGFVVGTLEFVAGRNYSFINPISKPYVMSLLRKAGADPETTEQK